MAQEFGTDRMIVGDLEKDIQQKFQAKDDDSDPDHHDEPSMKKRLHGNKEK